MQPVTSINVVEEGAVAVDGEGESAEGVDVGRDGTGRSQRPVASLLSSARANRQRAAVGAMALAQKAMSTAFNDEPTRLARECKQFHWLKQHFLPWSAVMLVAIGSVFCVVGLILDFRLYEEPTLYWMYMPEFGMLTWALTVTRVALAAWKSPRGSDAVGTLTFLAAFVVLHVFVFEQVGIRSTGSIYSPAYTAMERRLQAPLPDEVKDIGDIHAWMMKWIEEWIPEKTGSHVVELHPGWIASTPPSVWTQRVKRGACGYFGFGWDSCSIAGELNEATEMTDPWTLPLLDPATGVVAEKECVHQSGEFLNFHGQTKQNADLYGKLGMYRFRRGYYFELLDDIGWDFSNGPAPIANKSRALEITSGLGSAGLIDSDTRLVYMSVMLTNGALHQWISLRVVFEIGVSGQIETSTKIQQGLLPYCRFDDSPKDRSLAAFLQDAIKRDAESFSGYCSNNKECEERLEAAGVTDYECTNIGADSYWPAAVAAFLGMTDKLMFPLSVGSGHLLITLCALVTVLLLEEIGQMALTGTAYFKDVSNYLELFTIFDVYMMVEASISQQDATPQDSMSWELYTGRTEQLQRLCGLACFIWWMRMLNLVSRLHPRMRVLIHTMQKAWVDLAFFCTMFGIVLFAFSITLHIWFAATNASFHDLFVTFTTLFRGLIGDINAKELLGTWESVIFYMMYVVLSLLIMVNVFIAIISASFEAQHEEVQVQEQLRKQRESDLESWISQEPSERGEDGSDVDVLKIVLWGGWALRPSDWGGFADSYAIVGLQVAGDGTLNSRVAAVRERDTVEMLRCPIGGRMVDFEAQPVQSEVCPRSLNPEWGLKATFTLPRGAAESDNLEVYVLVLDQDTLKPDDWMGMAQVSLGQLLDGRGDRKVTNPWASSLLVADPQSPSQIFSSGRAHRRLRRRQVKVHRGHLEAGVVDVSAVLYSAQDGGRQADAADSIASASNS